MDLDSQAQGNAPALERHAERYGAGFHRSHDVDVWVPSQDPAEVHMQEILDCRRPNFTASRTGLSAAALAENE